jgi:hypothetical protein
MDIHDKTRMRLSVKNSDISGSVFDDVPDARDSST